MFKTLDLEDINTSEAQHFLQHAIAPRPIAFASTVDGAGNVNLSPFSFFNLFSINPPVVVFSPSSRVRDSTSKHTLENLQEVPEVVINIVTYDMVQQVSLSSCEFPKGVNEFNKAGFTQISSKKIRPPRVKESPVQMECKVLEIKPMGTQGGAGNLVIAEILVLHVNSLVLDENGSIDQQKLSLTARLGGNWYARITPENLFQVKKPNREIGIGIDSLPPAIRESNILTGNHLARLANVSEIPSIEPSFHDEKLTQIFQYFAIDPEELEKELHQHAGSLLDQEKTDEAWQVLLATAQV